MATTKENCYQSVDRSILIELKKIYQFLESKIKERNLSQIENETYIKLKELFTDALYRPFFQGNNDFTFINDIDNKFFRSLIYKTLTYLNIVTEISDDFIKNRLQLILDMGEEISEIHADNDFANGKPLDIRQMSEEDYRRAAKEFAEGSKSLEEFLLKTYQDKMYTKACCKGHDCIDGTKTTSYIAFDLGEYDEKKLYLMSKAFENGMSIAIIDFDQGFGFDIILNPYEIEEQISYLTECLENYVENSKINPIITETLSYMKNIGHKTDRTYSIQIFKAKDGIGIEENTSLNSGMRGIFEETRVLEAYSQKNSTKLKEKIVIPNVNPQASSKDIAKTALELAKYKPGKFADSMKRTLNLFKKMLQTRTNNINLDRNIDFE